MKVSLLLQPYHDIRWDLASQLGVTSAVTRLPHGEEGEDPWDYIPLLHMKQRFADAGLSVEVIEETPPLDQAKIGGPGADTEISRFCDFLRNAAAAGIPMVCWNWMAGFNWLRTSVAMPSRGGALVTGYDHSLMARARPTPLGVVEEERLWASLAVFLDRVVPVAETAGIRLALHPDDPPVSPIRGIARIIRSPEAMERALDLAPSKSHGVAFCQGTFAEMGCEIPATIRRFAARGGLHFVHFRDVQGGPERFVETFHDVGMTDMREAIRTYQEVGFEGPLRPDHVPTMAGESNDDPGYAMLGRLFAIGYIKGLIEGLGQQPQGG